MLKYGNTAINKNNNSIMGSIGNIVDIEIIKNKIKKCFDIPLDRLIENNEIEVTPECVSINDDKYLTADENGDFIWPDDVPVKFKECSGPGIIPTNIKDRFHMHNLDASNLKAKTEYIHVPNRYWVKEVELDNGKTDKLENIDELFEQLVNVSIFDLSTGNLTNIKSAKSTFLGTPSLKEVKFSKEGMPSLIDTTNMFYRAGKDEAVLNLSGIKTGNIVSAQSMFNISNFKEIDIRGWKFDSNCDFTKFAYNCPFLKVFNGVQLQKEGISKDENGNYKYDNLDRIIPDGTDACVDIIKNPDKYSEYLVK